VELKQLSNRAARGDADRDDKERLQAMQQRAEPLNTLSKSLDDVQKKLQSVNLASYDSADVNEALSLVDSVRSTLGGRLDPFNSDSYPDSSAAYDLLASPYPLWILATLGLTFIFCSAIGWWGFRFFVRFHRFSNNPAALGLLITSSDLVEYLDYELTRSKESEISIPIIKDLSARLTLQPVFSRAARTTKARHRRFGSPVLVLNKVHGTMLFVGGL
jgi:hypothetical protein